jgi:uncharacterized protein YbjT (DUF2867 family)
MGHWGIEIVDKGQLHRGKKFMILVTGATGTNGLELVKLLASRSVPVRALVRSAAKAKDMTALWGIEVVFGDFDDRQSIERAVWGIERAFLLTNSTERAEEQQRTFVTIACHAGVRRIVKLSQFAADENSPVRFLRYHAAVERAIVESGIGYTFIRPNLFMQGLLSLSKSIKTESRFFAAAGDAKVSVVDVRDNAAVAAAALTEEGHEGRAYTLTGPAALTHAELAEILSKAIGRPIEFIDIPSDTMRNALLAMGMPRWQVDGLVEDYAHYRRGEAAIVMTGVRDATGHSPRSFADFARDYASAFS